MMNWREFFLYNWFWNNPIFKYKVYGKAVNDNGHESEIPYYWTWKWNK